MKKLLILPLLLFMFIPSIVNAEGNYLEIKWYEYDSITEMNDDSIKAMLAMEILSSMREINCNYNNTNLKCYNKDNVLLFSAKSDENGITLIRINENLTFDDNIKYTFPQQIKEEIENDSSLSMLRGYDGIYFMLVEEPEEIYNETGECDSKAISISSIKVKQKDESVTEINKATTRGNNINLNISMMNVGDSIEYEVIVKNQSNKDFELDKNSFNLGSKYMDYTITSPDNSNIVKAQSSKTVYLKVKYKTEVPASAFENGIFNDNLTMTVNLSNGSNTPNKIKNPNTGIQYYVLILILALVIGTIVFIILKQKKYSKLIMLLIISVILIPTSIYALCKIEIKVNSTVKIIKESGTFCINFNRIENERLYFEYNKGDTLKNYYTNIINNIDNYSNYSLERDNYQTNGYYLNYNNKRILGYITNENNDELRFYSYVNNFDGKEEDIFEEPIIDSIYGCYYRHWVV